MRITNDKYVIGYQGENISREIKFEIDDYLKDCQIFIEFETPNGAKFTSKQIENIDKGVFLVPYELLVEKGRLQVQLVATRTNGFREKSATKSFDILYSINASEELIESDGEWKLIGDLYNKVYERAVSLELDNSNGIIKLLGKDKDNNDVVLSTIDLPTEKIIKNVYYDNLTQELVFVFENADSVRVPIGNMIELNDYYTKEEIDSELKKLVDDLNISINSKVSETTFNEFKENINTEISNKQEQIDNVNVNINKLEKIIDNQAKKINQLEQASDGVLLENHEDESEISYERKLPFETLPYGTIDKIGGMTYFADETITNTKPTAITFNKKNVIKYTAYNSTTSVYEFTREENGWCTLTKNNTSFANVNIFDGRQNSIPPGQYSIRVVFENNVISDLGSFVVEYGYGSNDRFVTLAYASGYQELALNSTKNIERIYLYASENKIIDSVKFKVEMVKGVDFSSIKTINVPIQIQTLKNYGMGIDLFTNNYIDLVNGKYVEMCDVVNLGDLQWFITSTNTTDIKRMRSTDLQNVIIKNPSANATINVSCSKYNAVSPNATYLKTNGISIDGNGVVSIYDENYNTTDSLENFKTAMQGVYLVYPLATPIETDISQYLKDIDYFVSFDGVGSLTFENENKQAVVNTISYQVKL